MKRIVIFCLIAGSLWTAEAIWLTTRQPETSARLALQQLNGGGDEARRLREFEAFKNMTTEVSAALTVLAAWLCFDSIIRKNLGLVSRSIIRFGHKAQLPMLLAVFCLMS